MASARQVADNSVQYVQIDGLVVLKIIKHCQEEGAGGTDLVQGVLLGLVEDNRLEVTNCFPFPRHTEEEQFDEVKYQMEMMRNLRQVNIDHLHVGWYQSTYFGTYLNKALLDSQFNYQHSIEESIVLIYDPLRTTKGHLTLKALRLTPKMMEMYSEGDFTPDKVKESGITFEDMFEEIPVVVKNSHLVNALLCETSERMPQDSNHQFLDLATGSILEKNLQLQMDCVDDLAQEANRFFNYQRQMARYNQLKTQYQAKHESENKARVQRGEPPLPDEDYSRTLKLPPQPSRLDSLLIAGQVCSYAEQTSQFATQAFGKLFMADSLQGEKDKPTSQ